MNKLLQQVSTILLVLTGFALNAQNVGINATGTAPDAGAMLDIASTNKGLLIPRVNIADLTTIAPITGSATTSMLVYNTNAGTGLGYYYWDGNDWIQFTTGTPLVDNGLYYNAGANRVRLGGPLVENTTITQGAQQMTFNLNGTGDFNVQDNGTTRFSVQDNGRTTVGGTANAGRFNVTGNSYFSDDIYLRDGAVNTGDILVRIFDSADDGIIDIYENNARNIRLHGNGVSVFNEQGISTNDFRIEGDTKSDLFFVDAGNEVIGFQKAPSTPTLGGGIVNEIFFPIEIGSDGGGALQATIGWYAASDVEILPETDWYGYVGNGTYAWYRMTSYGFINVSASRKKRDITPINGNDAVENYVLNEIDKIQPYFYKYINEEDELDELNYTKHRPMMHIGALVEESPDFIKDEAFSGIDIYGLASLSLVGVKANRDAIKKMQKQQETIIQDFGSLKVSQNKTVILLKEEFKTIGDAIPVITVTTNTPDVSAYIVKKTNSKFVVELKGNLNAEDVYIDWIAIAKTELKVDGFNGEQIDDNLRKQLEISDEKKMQMKKLFNQKPSLTPLKKK